MIALQLFPSRTVSLYMARMFLVRTFAILTALVFVADTWESALGAVIPLVAPS